MPCSLLTARQLQHSLHHCFWGYSFCRADHEAIMKAVLLQDTLTHQASFLFCSQQKINKKEAFSHTYTHSQNTKNSGLTSP